MGGVGIEIRAKGTVVDVDAWRLVTVVFGVREMLWVAA